MKTIYLPLIFLAVVLSTGCGDDGGSETPGANFVLSASSSSSTVAENGGSLTITVSLDAVNSGDAISFELQASGQATLNTDYQLAGNQSIPNGSQTATITLTALNDSDVEGDESIVLSLQENESNVAVSGGSLNLTLTDDDSAPGACVGTLDTYGNRFRSFEL